MDISLSCKLLKVLCHVLCVIDYSGAFITKDTTAKVRREGIRQNSILNFVLDCNRFSHGDCLNKQGDCVKTSPRGMCCVNVENGLLVRGLCSYSLVSIHYIMQHKQYCMCLV